MSVLTAALESRFAVLRDLAVEAILSRRSISGHRVLLRRLHLLSEDCRKRIKQHPGHITRALRHVILETEEQTCANGCQAALWLHEYDLIPALINAVTDQGNPNVELAGRTLLKLVESLYAELASPGEFRASRDTNNIRRHTITVLESAVGRYSQHRRREVIESFLILTNHNNVVLKQILSDPRHPAFVVMIETLSRSEHGGVIRLLLALLDDPDAPSAALSVIGNRYDPRFLRFLLQKIGREPSKAAGRNLKRIESIGWLRDPASVVDALDEAEQHSLVKLVTVSGVPRHSAFDLVAHILERGRPGGRRAAAETLCEFNGARANALTLACLDDDDPEVQSRAIAQLRSRGIPGSLSRLVDKLESPHAAVRRSAQESLSEFSFQRFLGAFDMLDEDVRRNTGMLVKKIDPRVVPILAGEMESPMRTQRLRSLAAARTMEVVEELEPNIIVMLDDEDHRVRVEAATSLCNASSQAAKDALRRALLDSSPAVREAAQASLETIARGASPTVAAGGGR